MHTYAHMHAYACMHTNILRLIRAFRSLFRFLLIDRGKKEFDCTVRLATGADYHLQQPSE